MSKTKEIRSSSTFTSLGAMLTSLPVEISLLKDVLPDLPEEDFRNVRYRDTLQIVGSYYACNFPYNPNHDYAEDWIEYINAFNHMEEDLWRNCQFDEECQKVYRERNIKR